MTGDSLVIRGGTVILPTGRRSVDIAVKQGVVSAIGTDVRDEGEVIDATGLVVLPGLVDAHVHFNEPGRADWEGWDAGTRGAAAGGVTTVLEMPLNAHPPTISAQAFDAKRRVASEKARVDFGLWGGLVNDNLAELEGLAERGVVAFKAFMSDSGVDDFRRVPDGVLAAGLKAAARLGVVVGVHAESHEMVERLGSEMRGRREKGRLSWCRARPPAAELEAIKRLVSCVRGAGPGARAHVVHVSTAEGLAEVQGAREWGLAVTAETCPHYLDFDEQDFERLGPALKCAPPIRDAASRERLWTALLAGEVDLVASDHSPCPAADKKKGEHDIWQAWGGVAGIQATLPVLLTGGVHARGLSRAACTHAGFRWSASPTSPRPRRQGSSGSIQGKAPSRSARTLTSRWWTRSGRGRSVPNSCTRAAGSARIWAARSAGPTCGRSCADGPSSPTARSSGKRDGESS